MEYYKRRTKEEHAFRTFAKTCETAEKTGVWPRLFLLSGREHFLIDWAERELRKKLVEPSSADFDCNVFSGDGFSAGDLIAACETLPMMSPKKVVIIKHTDILSDIRSSSMSEEDIETLTAYIPNIPETTVLIFISPKTDRRKAICKAIAKTGLVYDFKALDEGSLATWMMKKVSEAGRTASKSELLRYARSAGYGDSERSYTMYDLENDIKKALALTDSETITANDLMLAGGGEPETAAFTILDAAFSGRKGYALTVLNNSIDSQLASKEAGVILSFLGLLCSQLEIMVEAAERKEEGQPQSLIESEMKVHPYRLRKAQAASAGMSAAGLRESLFKAFQIEKDMKSGLIDPKIDLELFIAQL